jgi:LysR family hydrogen peroxide-inducible transcriptional activator
MPTLRQLQYLAALADTRHFRRAAERVNASQPTLSEQLKALEERLGVQLIERSTARVIITPLGQCVVDIARRMLRDANEIRTLTASSAKELSGLVKLGVPPTIGPYLMHRAAPKLHKAHPDLKLYVREELPQALPPALQDGVHDVIVTTLPLRLAEIETITLFKEPLLLTVAADHPLSRKRSVSLSDLAGEDVLALGPGHQLHGAVLTVCKEVGAKLRYDFEGTSLDMLREMIVMGLGITFMPGLYVKSELMQDPGVKVLALKDRRLYRSIGMAWRRTSARRTTFLKLADLMKRTVATRLGP